MPLDLRRRRVRYYLYAALGELADLVQDVLGLFQNLRPKLTRSEAPQWSEELRLHKCQHATPLEDAQTWLGGGSVYVIDDATMMKMVGGDPDTQFGQEREVLNHSFVLEHTTIPTPNIHAVVPYPGRDYGGGYMIMDYIHGQRLDRAWPRLSIWNKLRVAWILRSYIRQLRRIRHPRSSIPGPLGPGPRLCPEGTIDSLYPRGPFRDAMELTTFLNERSRAIRGVDIPHEYREPEPLVFTHADLNMRNIIIDDDGRVWVIDWDWSGFYPQSWEYISMAFQAEAHPQDITPRSWQICVPFIAGPYFSRYRWRFGLPL